MSLPFHCATCRWMRERRIKEIQPAGLSIYVQTKRTSSHHRFGAWGLLGDFLEFPRRVVTSALAGKHRGIGSPKSGPRDRLSAAGGQLLLVHARRSG